jgi:beta-glucoside operon transcriptional antiterminator
MKVLRVFNNNVVLAADDAGGEVILTGRGLGFQARPGQDIDMTKVVRTFVPADGRDPDHLAQLVAAIPPEHIQLVVAAMSAAGMDAQAAASPTLVIALADHVSFSLRRADLGMVLEYPLLGEVQHLYRDEYDRALALLGAVNARIDRPLPDGEAVALTLHMVNAGFSTGDLSYTYTMTGVIQQLVAVIEQQYGIPLDVGSVNVGRFITHLRYLFVRIHQHSQLAQEHSRIGAVIRDTHPRALECADRLAAVLELRLGSALTEDEISYLTLHIARVAGDPG